jgi:hypothetical protein
VVVAIGQQCKTDRHRDSSDKEKNVVIVSHKMARGPSAQQGLKWGLVRFIFSDSGHFLYQRHVDKEEGRSGAGKY